MPCFHRDERYSSVMGLPHHWIDVCEKSYSAVAHALKRLQRVISHVERQKCASIGYLDVLSRNATLMSLFWWGNSVGRERGYLNCSLYMHIPVLVFPAGKFSWTHPCVAFPTGKFSRMALEETPCVVKVNTILVGSRKYGERHVKG
jgi:hypothetical protein